MAVEILKLIVTTEILYLPIAKLAEAVFHFCFCEHCIDDYM